MAGETVTYRNEMNLVPLRKFTATEIDLFFAMCNKLKEQGTKTLKLSFDDLKQLSNYNHEQRNLKRFIKDIEEVYSKIMKIHNREENEKKIKYFMLFNNFEIDKEEKYLQISINPKFKHILNDITRDFTKFELQELTRLKSSYSKTAFRLFKQFKHTGYVIFSLEDFKSRFDVPKSYRMTDIDKNVLKPIVKELNNSFADLSINKIKAKKGRKIEKIEITFIPEKRIHSKKNPNHSIPFKNKHLISREMTPDWMENREYQNTVDVSDLTEEDIKNKEQLLAKLNANQ